MSGPTSSAASSRFGALYLRTRLLAAFLVVSLTSVVVAGFALTRMSSISDQAQAVYERGTVQLDGTRGLQVLWWEYAAHDARTAIEGIPPDILAEEQKAATETAQEMAAEIENVQAMDLPSAVAGDVAAFAAAVDGNNAALDKLANPQMTPAEQGAAIAELGEFGAQAEESITAANAAEQQEAARQAASAQDAYESARTLTLVIIVAGLLISVGLGIVTARSVSRPIAATREVLAKVADGDLTVRAEEGGSREIAEMNRSLNATLDALTAVMVLVRDFAQRLAGSSTQLAGHGRRHRRQRAGRRPSRPTSSRRRPVTCRATSAPSPPGRSRCRPPSARSHRARTPPPRWPATPSASLPTRPRRSASSVPRRRRSPRSSRRSPRSPSRPTCSL